VFVVMVLLFVSCRILSILPSGLNVDEEEGSANEEGNVEPE